VNIKVAGISAAAATLAVAVATYFEGFYPVGHRDPVGIVTDCWGHTKTALLGVTNTREQCLAKLQTDMQEHWDGLAKCAPELRRQPDHVQAAMLSWGFNVGVGAACGSTAMRKLRAGDTPGACAELSRWVMAGGKPLPGLVRRRAAERAVCEGRPPSLGAIG